MSTTQQTLKRSGPLAALFVLALALTTPAASAEPKVEATEWLGAQLKTPEGLPEQKYCESFGSPSVGQTIDCTLAFQAAGEEFGNERDETYEWAIANMSAYVGAKPCSEASSMSAGAVAKLALGVSANGGDPSSAGPGERDLIADLECLQDKSGEEEGRFKDKGELDFSNVFGQSLALLALKACVQGACESPPIEQIQASIADGAEYLRGQQCAESEPEALDGAFRSPMGLSPTACNDEPPFEPENLDAVDVDSTGVASQALLAEGSEASEGAGFTALLWLVAEEQEGGFWESHCDFESASEPFPSVNSTAVATMAYAYHGGPEPGPAQEWLASTVTLGVDDGMPACGTSGPGDVRATAQGILGLFGTSYPDLVGL